MNVTKNIILKTFSEQLLFIITFLPFLIFYVPLLLFFSFMSLATTIIAFFMGILEGRLPFDFYVLYFLSFFVFCFLGGWAVFKIFTKDQLSKLENIFLFLGIVSYMQMIGRFIEINQLEMLANNAVYFWYFLVYPTFLATFATIFLIISNFDRKNVA